MTNRTKELELLIEAHKAAFDRAMLTQSDPLNDHSFVAQDWDAEQLAADAVEAKAVELGVSIRGWYPVEIVPEPQVHPLNGRVTGATRRELS